MAGPDLASMLKSGGGVPPGAGAPDAGGPPDADEATEGKMPPDQAIQILQQFKIPPDPKILQQVCDAAEVGMTLLAQQGGDQGGPPPGAGGPPPPPGA